MWLTPQVDEHNKVARIGGREIREGDWISLNGSTGEIIAGKQQLRAAELSQDMDTFMSWVDGRRTLGEWGVSRNVVVFACAKQAARRCCCVCGFVMSVGELGLRGAARVARDYVWCS